MAITKSPLVKKTLRQRGTLGGQEQEVTGVVRLAAGASIATTDLLQMVNLGENVRPIRLTLTATPVAGNPVLTAFTFKAGVAPDSTLPFKRPDGTEYPAIPVDDDALVASLAIPAGKMITSVAVTRPVADNVPNYSPYFVTLVPTAAASVAGGDVDLALTVTWVAEQKANGFIYDQMLNGKVRNA